MADNITENAQPASTEQPVHPRWGFLKKISSRFGGKSEGSRYQPQTETPALIKTARQQIIDSVLSEGLLSRPAMKNQGIEFLGSIDKDGVPNIMGRAIKPKREYRDEKDFQNALEQALYWGDNSCLPVVAERPGESWQEKILFRSTQTDRDRISGRVFASFLVITKSGPDTAYFTKDESQTKPQDFAALIFPDQILREYDPDSTKLNGKNVKSVNKTVNRSLLMGDPITVPDYEEAIKEVLEELDSPIWIHAVRLPVSEDLSIPNSGNGSAYPSTPLRTAR